jgi:branched-chain amino acid transport system substrate-binding protein
MDDRVGRRFTALAVAAAAGLLVAGLLVAGCSSSTSGGSGSGTSSAAPVSTAALGTPSPAAGDPVVFGVLNLQSGPVTFPEVVQAEQAAVSYVNAYKGGIGGRPIKLVTCATDGQPSTSQRCANQIADQKPVAILGGADTGAPGAFPVWQRANLAYLGGVPFTPVEQNSPLSVIFSSVSSGDNAAASVYAAKTLHAKKAAIIYTSDTQGTSVTQNVLVPTMTKAGITSITKVAIPPTSSDVASAVATAVGAHPDVIYINAPAACPNILSSLKQLGNTAKIMGIDPCTSPKAIAGANGGANGLYFAGPTLDAGANTAESNLYLAVLKKYAPADIALDSLAAIGFQTVIDVQAALAKFTAADLTTDKILAAFKTGTETANFMGHPYLCDGKQLAGATSICNAYEQVRQVQGDKIVVASPDFVTAGTYYTG